jgi:murein DD-endopeptidase MepM/ murein hydrolase activator NlpD
MRFRRLGLGALVLAMWSLIPVAPATADTTTTTTPDTTTTTTTTTSTSTTTTAPNNRTTTTTGRSSATTVAPAVPAPPPEAAGDDVDCDALVLPPELQAQKNAVRRSRTRDNAALLGAVRVFALRARLPLDQAMALALGHFPVAGPAHWVHDWLMPRCGPPVHLHQGIDIWAAKGTPIRAPSAGRVRYENGGLGGLAAYVTTPGGTYYYLAHMDRTAPGIAAGTAVVQGQIVGFVGDSGNAQGGAAHLHFEIHPRGGAAVDPKAIVDQWVDEAIVYATVLGTNPTATTLPDPGFDAFATPPARTHPRPTRRLRTVNTGTRAPSSGAILVIGSLVVLCCGRMARRVRANMPPDHEEPGQGDT